MKPTFTKSINSSSFQKGGSNAQYESKVTNQSGNNSNIDKYRNRGAISPTNIPKHTSAISKGVTNSQTGRITDLSKYEKKGTNVANNKTKNSVESNWQNNKPKVEPKYDNRHIGNSHSKIETIQDGDYILKITTIRKVIERETGLGNWKDSFVE